MQQVIILGGHGDGVVLAQAIRDIQEHDDGAIPVGFLNDHAEIGTEIDGLPVLESIPAWQSVSEEYVFISALHKVKDMARRIDLVTSLDIPENRWTNIIHPSASVARDVEIGVGNFIGQNVVIQPGARLGNHCSLRAGANVGHDATLDSFCYIGPNATLCGKSAMGTGAHLSPNGVVMDGVCMSRLSVVGVGSALTKDTTEGGIYFGTPARLVTRVDGCANKEPTYDTT